MDVVLLIIFITFVYLIIATISYFKRISFLRKELSIAVGKKVILAEERDLIPYDERLYEVWLVPPEDLYNKHSLAAKLMRQTGVQKLPSAFWIGDDGKIQHEILEGF